jgi:Flp pilus assembly protein TadD
MTQPNPAPSALLKEAIALHTAGRLGEAETKYCELLGKNNNCADALHLLGTLRYQQGNAVTAIEFIERAIAISPTVPEMHLNLGAAYRASGQAVKAAQSFRKARELNPSLSIASFNLGHALRDAGDLSAALSAYKIYLGANPKDAKAHNLVGDVCKELGKHHEAIEAYETALTIDANRPGAMSNIAALFRDLGWPYAARVVMNRALELAPTDPDILRTHGTLSLLIGDIETGWRGLENRFQTTAEAVPSRSIPPIVWGGEDLSGKSIIVWTEQGLGDEVLHASILHEVIARADRCIVECSERMVPVFARSFPSAEVVGCKAPDSPVTPPEGIDYQIPIGSLGLHFRPDFARFPKHEGYLRADPAKVNDLRRRYEDMAGGRRIVGLSWRSKNERIGEAKSTGLSGFAPIFQTPGVMFVNLQYGECSEELAEVRERFGVEVVQDQTVDPIKDMDAFFAQVAAMDLVLSTSNTTAHVAGAQNIPVWVLLPHGKGVIWYWFLRRSDSPWYPSARLIRTDHKLDEGQARWLDLAKRTADDLAHWAQGT